MAHWKRRADAEYIGHWDLDPGESRTVVIRSISNKEVIGDGGRKQNCIIAYLEGKDAKPMILNATNCKSIESLYGSDDAKWAGKAITLYIGTANLKGETVPCLRIRSTVTPVVAKRTLDEERFVQAIVNINAGRFTEEKLRATFELTESQDARLTEVLTAGVDA